MLMITMGLMAFALVCSFFTKTRDGKKENEGNRSQKQNKEPFINTCLIDVYFSQVF